MRLLVAGGAGFIGSHFVEYALRHGDEVTVLDKLTYAGRRENLAAVEGDIEFWHGDITNASMTLMAARHAEAIVNFAAETHVDRSISDSRVFTQTNVIGTHCLLETARGRGLRYVQVSTDEVYGSIQRGSFTEESPLQPSSPYSASKTGADLLVESYCRTYGLDTTIVRGSNNYGPRQYPEKLIPLAILKALRGEAIPIYGDGQQVRNWIHVSDFTRGIHHLVHHGAAGGVYNCGGPSECQNIDVVKMICRSAVLPYNFEWVEDRLGHDRRYSLDSSLLRAHGWSPNWGLREGIEATVKWYVENEDWWRPLVRAAS